MCYVDSSGELCFGKSFSHASSFSEERAIVIETDDSDLMGFIDTSGNYILTPQADISCPFHEALHSSTPLLLPVLSTRTANRSFLSKRPLTILSTLEQKFLFSHPMVFYESKMAVFSFRSRMIPPNCWIPEEKLFLILLKSKRNTAPFSMPMAEKKNLQLRRKTKTITLSISKEKPLQTLVFDFLSLSLIQTIIAFIPSNADSSIINLEEVYLMQKKYSRRTFLAASAAAALLLTGCSGSPEDPAPSIPDSATPSPEPEPDDSIEKPADSNTETIKDIVWIIQPNTTAPEQPISLDMKKAALNRVDKSSSGYLLRLYHYRHRNAGLQPEQRYHDGHTSRNSRIHQPLV